MAVDNIARWEAEINQGGGPGSPAATADAGHPYVMPGS